MELIAEEHVRVNDLFGRAAWPVSVQWENSDLARVTIDFASVE